jgi:Asp-tRNA(Asn)/Glu-tRNA(Gln) amidotransferase A subunit family amidase
MIEIGWIRTLSPLSPPAARPRSSRTARAGATVADVKWPASFAACREMIAGFAGVPASSRPSGVSSLGLPHAVQLVRDADLLAVAARCERVLDFKPSPSM